MSYIEDFNKFNPTIRALIVFTAGNIPFWVIAIYLFSNKIYSSNDYLLISSIVLCLSIVWCFFTFVFTSLNAAKYDDLEKNKPADRNQYLPWSAGVSVFHLSVLIWALKDQNITLTTFAWWIAGTSVFRAIVNIISVYIHDKREQKKKK